MGKGLIKMCLGSSPKVETPAPAPTFEQAKTDDVVTARTDERKRLRRAFNTRTTMLGGALDTGRKTLLGQ